MKYIRIKTKEEFIKDGLWTNARKEYEGNPIGWESAGKMNEYLGFKMEHMHSIPNSTVRFKGWAFVPEDFILVHENYENYENYEIY